MPTTARCPNPDCLRTTTFPDGHAPRLRCPACGREFDPDSVATRPVPGPLTEASTVPTAVAVERVGRFVVRGWLGAGAFGFVYRAYDPQLQREVALKIPNPAVLADPVRVERFLREARAAANLRHPHVVPVYDAGKDGENYFIASAFVEGRPLADILGGAAVDFRRAARLGRELASALAYAHGQGVVHRDVKPHNLMLDPADHLHLMDFGLAVRAEDSGGPRLTNDGAVMGTPAYMAPEQAEGKSVEAGAAADQYSAGVVLYEMLTGRPPFEGPPAVLMFHAVHTDPAPPRKRRPGVPRDLETICLKAMAKRPADRYPDCGGLADDLRRWLDGEPIAARRLSAAERLTRWARRNKLVAGLAAGAAASLVTGTAVSLAFWGRAERNAAAATAAQERAERSEFEAKRRLYLATVNLIQRGFESGNRNQAVDGLRDTTPPADDPTAPDLRAFEWYYWRQQIGHALGEFRGHEDRVLHAVWSTDGTTLATHSRDRTARVWDAATFREKARVGGQPEWYGVLAFSPDGKWLGTLNADNRFAVWDAATGRPERATGGQLGMATNGKQVVTWDAARARLWDQVGGEVIREWDQPVKGGPYTRLSRDGRRFTVFGEQYPPVPLVVWEVGTGRELARLDVNTRGFDFSPAPGGFLATSVNGRDVALFSADGKKQYWRAAPHHTPGPVGLDQVIVNAIRFSPDGNTIAFGSFDGVAWLLDARTSFTRRRIPAHAGPVRCVEFSPDGSKLFTGGDDAVGRLWDLTQNPNDPAVGRHSQSAWSVAFAPDGRRFATVGHDGVVRIWDAAARKPVGEFPVTGEPPTKSIAMGTTTGVASGIAWSADGRIAVACNRGPVRVFSEAGEQQQILPGHKGGARAVAFSPDGELLVSGGWDRVVRVWGRDGAEVKALTGAVGPVTCVAFRRDGREIAAGSGRKVLGGWRDGQVLLWSVPGWESTVRTEGLSRGVVAVAYGGRNRLAASAGEFLADAAVGNLVRCWEPDGRVLFDHAPQNTSDTVAVSPDGRRVATHIGRGRAVVLWDADTGQETVSLRPGAGPVWAVAFNPDGSRLAAACGHQADVGASHDALVWEAPGLPPPPD